MCVCVFSFGCASPPKRYNEHQICTKRLSVDTVCPWNRSAVHRNGIALNQCIFPQTFSKFIFMKPNQCVWFCKRCTIFILTLMKKDLPLTHRQGKEFTECLCSSWPMVYFVIFLLWISVGRWIRRSKTMLCRQLPGLKWCPDHIRTHSTTPPDRCSGAISLSVTLSNVIYIMTINPMANFKWTGCG